jgi:DNA-directed RNA polymerase subunit RPC12/RpoP
MYFEDNENIYVCHQCIGDDYLKNEIKSEGARNECSYCGNRRLKALPLMWLANKVHEAIEQHYQLGYVNTPYGWEPDGEPINFLIQEMAEIDEPIANDVQEYLSFWYGPNLRDYSEDDPYGDEAYYMAAPPDGWKYQESWRFFCDEVLKRSRFFSPVAEGVLKEIFGNIASLENREGISVIREAGPETELNEVFRARVAQTTSELDRILAEPEKELASPPFKFAKGGRMNAAGISTFYGAESAETCVAEVRPPVGGRVVVGRFQIIRRLRLLDFSVLSDVYAKGSVFDPTFADHVGHTAFFESLVRELTLPVLPGEETFKYLPTQVVAEYLAERVCPKLDGIIFSSTQDGEKGENIVLFQGCSTVEPYALPKGTQLSVTHGHWENHVEYDDSIIVTETVPPEPKEVSAEDSWVGFHLPSTAENDNCLNSSGEITL